MPFLFSSFNSNDGKKKIPFVYKQTHTHTHDIGNGLGA